MSKINTPFVPEVEIIDVTLSKDRDCLWCGRTTDTRLRLDDRKYAYSKSLDVPMCERCCFEFAQAILSLYDIVKKG